MSLALRWGTGGILTLAASTALAQSNEPQRFQPPVHVQPVSQNVLRASGTESLYGDDEKGLRWQSADESHRREASRVPSDNAVYRKPAEDDQDGRLQGILIKEEESGPTLAAPIDDPYGDRKPNLRTEHEGSEASATTRGAGRRRGMTAGYRQEPIQDPAQDQGIIPNPDLPQGEPTEASCEEYRQQLLNQPITALEVNISAPRPNEFQQQGIQQAESRKWLDRNGNTLAEGRLVELRHGYAVIDTSAGRQKIAVAQMSDEDLGAIAKVWRVPTECTMGDMNMVERCWVQQTYTWKASDLCHKPLYFEDEQLERYGHSAGPVLQPIKSTAHFFVRLATWPYQKGIHPCNECQYALGFYRPGNCAPWLCDPVPISLAGATHMGVTATSAAFILP